MFKIVIVYLGLKLSDIGVLILCGVSFEWLDGRMGIFWCFFLGDMVMKVICVGFKGILEIDDFVIFR